MYLHGYPYPFGITELYPTIGGGKEWFCNWQSGGLRYINYNAYDATDSDFGFLIGGSHDHLRVSCGVCKIKEYSMNRLFVNGPWTNTEMTIYVKVKDASTTSIQMRSRANHFGVGLEPYASDAQYVNPGPLGVEDVMSCGFGNYLVRWGQTHPINFCDVGLEIIHNVYNTGLANAAFTMTNDVYIGYKQVTRTLANGHVKSRGV